MNKKFAFSKVTIYLLLLIVVLIAYAFLYFIPAQSQLTMIRSDMALYRAETEIYRQYLTDVSPLEADIKAIQDSIDELNATAYTNDTNVNLAISEATQRYRISLSSVTVGDETIIDGNSALPIILKVSGDTDRIVDFIRYFEDNKHGSYLVLNSSVEFASTTTSANLVIYLCTPNV